MAPRQGKELGSWELETHVPKKEGETRIRRSYCAKDGLISRTFAFLPLLSNLPPTDSASASTSLHRTEPAPGIDTTYDIVCYAASSHGSKEGFGTRSVERVISETKKVKKVVDGKEIEEDKEWKYFQLSPYRWIT